MKPTSPLITGVRLALTASGGVASHGELVAATSRHAVEVAVREGAVVRVRRGYYALTDPSRNRASNRVGSQGDRDAAAWSAARHERVHQHRVVATANRAILSHRSAAEYHGLPVLEVPDRPEIIVAPGRRLSTQQRRQTNVRTRALTNADHLGAVTSPLRTVLDCAADLPFAEALAVADSALRSDADHPPLVGRDELLVAAEGVRLQARGRVRRIAELADGRAANPLESALRALVHDIPGLCVVPQLKVALDVGDGLDDLDEERAVHVDLGDARLRIVLEADSYAWHGGPDGFDRDCERYNALTIEGWHILRLTWKAIVLRPDTTRAAIERLTQRRIARLT